MPYTAPRLIASRNHPRVKRIRLLQDRSERERTGLFFTEGMRFVAQAAGDRSTIETLLVAPELLTHPFGRKLVRDLRRKGTPALEVTRDVFHSLAQGDDPQGVGAVVRQQWLPLEQARPADGLCWVAITGLRSAGNLGTVIRTCDAVGAAGVVLLDGTADPYDPSTVRATMGALFSQRFVRASFGELLAWKRRHGCALVGTSPSAPDDYQEIRYGEPVVLLIGGERKGLPPEQQAQCDRLARIPMVGRSDSLNVAVATAVLLYEVFNQQRRTSAAG